MITKREFSLFCLQTFVPTSLAIGFMSGISDMINWGLSFNYILALQNFFRIIILGIVVLIIFVWFFPTNKEVKT